MGTGRRAQSLEFAGRFSGRLERKEDEPKLKEECQRLGPLVGGVGSTGESARNSLPKLVRSIAKGQVREHLMQQQKRLEKLKTALVSIIEMHKKKDKVMEDIKPYLEQIVARSIKGHSTGDTTKHQLFPSKSVTPGPTDSGTIQGHGVALVRSQSEQRPEGSRLFELEPSLPQVQEPNANPHMYPQSYPLSNRLVSYQNMQDTAQVGGSLGNVASNPYNVRNVSAPQDAFEQVRPPQLPLPMNSDADIPAIESTKEQFASRLPNSVPLVSQDIEWPYAQSRATHAYKTLIQYEQQLQTVQQTLQDALAQEQSVNAAPSELSGHQSGDAAPAPSTTAPESTAAANMSPMAHMQQMTSGQPAFDYCMAGISSCEPQMYNMPWEHQNGIPSSMYQGLLQDQLQVGTRGMMAPPCTLPHNDGCQQ